MSKNHGSVVSLQAYRMKRKNKGRVLRRAESSPEADQCFDFTSDDFFAHIIQRNMEASRKLREDRLRKNSQVLKSYKIKK